jgi:hypothetical protein
MNMKEIGRCRSLVVGLPIDLEDSSPLRARASEQRASSCTLEGAKRVRVRRIDLGSCDASHSTERKEDDVGWQLARIRWLVRPATFGRPSAMKRLRFRGGECRVLFLETLIGLESGSFSFELAQANAHHLSLPEGSQAFACPSLR